MPFHSYTKKIKTYVRFILFEHIDEFFGNFWITGSLAITPRVLIKISFGESTIKFICTFLSLFAAKTILLYNSR